MNFYQARISALYPEEAVHTAWVSAIWSSQEEAIQDLQEDLHLILPCMCWRTTCLADYDETDEASVSLHMTKMKQWFDQFGSTLKEHQNKYGMAATHAMVFEDEVELVVDQVTVNLPPESLHAV